MALSVKHQFTSSVPDGGDTSVVQPSNWNAEHQITQSTSTLLGRVSSGTGVTEELTAAQVRDLLDAVVYVGSRSALKMLDTTKGNTAILAEDAGKSRGRFGRFFLGESSDYTSVLSTDTQEGFIVRSTFDVTKVWVRDTVILTPPMFGAVEGDSTINSYAAISIGIAVGVLVGKEFYFDGTYAIATRLDIPPTAKISSDRGAVLVPVTGSGLANGVLMEQGNHVGLCTLPWLSGFSGIALHIKASYAKIVVPYINFAGTAVVWDSTDAHCVSSTVETNTIADCNLAFEFICGGGGAANVIEGCGVKEAHFITRTTNLVLFSGGTGVFDGQFVEVDSVDFQTSVAGGIVFANTTGGNVPRFTFRCRSWFGGDGFGAGSPTTFFSGSWINCVFDIVEARPFTQNNIVPGNAFATRWKFRGQWPKSLAYEMSTTLGGFNGGTMAYATEFMVKITLGSDLLDGDALTRYFYHVLADSAYHQWEVMPADGAVGTFLDAVIDQTATESGRVAITIRNLSGVTIGTGTAIFLAVRRK